MAEAPTPCKAVILMRTGTVAGICSACDHRSPDRKGMEPPAQRVAGVWVCTKRVVSATAPKG